METLLNILDQAPKNVLKNLDFIVVGPGNNENNQMTQHMIGGHPITITQERLSEVEIKRQKSFVRDYISAKEKLSNELNSVGIKPASILPSDVFYKVLSECNLIRFEELGENGEQYFDFHQLHFPFAKPLFFISLIEDARFDNLQKSIPVLLDKNRFYYSSLFCTGAYLPPFEPYHLSWGNSEDNFFIFFPENGDNEASCKGFVYYACMPGIISHLKNLERNQDFESKIFDFESLKDVNNFWKLFFKNGFKDSEIRNYKSYSRAKVKVTFPEIPKDLQEMLLRSHEGLPHWKLYTAATPGAFKITNSRGLDILDYMKFVAIPTWKKVYERVNQKYEFLKSTNTLDEYLMSHQKDEDPIFYYIVKNTFNGVEYSHAVVFGQYGDFPDEKKAFEVSKVYSKAYEGSFQN